MVSLLPNPCPQRLRRGPGFGLFLALPLPRRQNQPLPADFRLENAPVIRAAFADDFVNRRLWMNRLEKFLEFLEFGQMQKLWKSADKNCKKF